MIDKVGMLLDEGRVGFCFWLFIFCGIFCDVLVGEDMLRMIWIGIWFYCGFLRLFLISYLCMYEGKKLLVGLDFV